MLNGDSYHAWPTTTHINVLIPTSFYNIIVDIEKQVGQSVMTSLLNQWAARKQDTEDKLHQFMTWVNKMLDYHPGAESKFTQQIRKWELWLKPRLSNTLVRKSSPHRETV